MSGRGAALACLIVALAFGAAAHAAEQFQPRKVPFVNRTDDHKHDRAVRSSAYWFQRDTGINLGIVFLDRLPGGVPIESHADVLFSELKLGRKSDGKALLFLWSNHERQFKIEVSYDLEGVFPDALCKRLEEGARTFMLSTSPYARRDFIVELIVTMKLHYLERGKPSDVPVPDAGQRYVGGYMSGGAGSVGRGYSAMMRNVQQELVALPPGLERDMQPGRTPEETLARYLASLELGIGAPNLPLLTEASRYFRMDKPHAPGYLKRIRAYIAKATPPTIRREGNLAAVVFGPRDPVLPIFMRRDPSGVWLVDEPKVWAAMHLFQDGSSNIKYHGMAFNFASLTWPGGTPRAPLFHIVAQPPQLLPLPTNLKDRVAAAEARVQTNPNDPKAWIALVDLMHFEIFWIQASESLYERIVALAPGRLDMQWRLKDMYEMTSDVDGQNRQWCKLLRATPKDEFVRRSYEHFRKSFYVNDPDTDLCR